MLALQTNSNQSPFVAAYHRPPPMSPYWVSGPQIQQQSRGNIAKFGGTLAGITALGFVPMGEKRLWDYYLKAIRGVEEISPMKILRTFQWSEVVSPLGANKTLSLSSELFTRTVETAEGIRKVPNMAMRELMARMTGTSITELQASGAFAEGLEFRRTGWLFGEITTPSGKVLSSAALPMQIRPRAGASFMDWFARASGMKLGQMQSIIRGEELVPAAVTTPKISHILGYPLSAQASEYLTKARTLARYQRAYWAGQIGRLNRLLLAPADILRLIGRTPRLTKAYERLGEALAVKPGTATQMLLRYTGKGLGIYAGYQGLQYLSYLRSKSDNRAVTGTAGAAIGAAIGMLVGKRRGLAAGAIMGGIIGAAPLFDQGIFQGFAEAWRKSTTGYAKVSEATGLTEAAREQEKLMPGITKARTLAGLTFGGTMMGLLMGGLLGKFTKREGLVSKFSKRGGMIGAGIWGIFALSAALATGHAPGILAAEHTPDELADIHEGRKLLPVRRGRYWEFGRSSWEGCLTPESVVLSSDGGEILAKDVRIGDSLIGINGNSQDVKAVSTRIAKEAAYTVYTSFDRRGILKLTGNHRVLVAYCPYYFKPGHEEPRLEWRRIDQIPKDGRYRLFVPYLLPLDIVDAIDVTLVLEDTVYRQGRWYTKIQSMWTEKMDRELLALKKLPPKSKLRAQATVFLQEKYGLTYRQIRYRLGDLHKADKHGWLLRRRKLITKTEPTIKLDYDFGKLCGYYASEGSAGGEGNGTLQFSFHVDETDFHAEVRHLLNKIFHLSPEKITSCPVSEDGIQIRCYDIVVKKIFQYLIPGTSLAGTKRLNPVLLSAPTEFIYGLIETMINGDGSLKEHNNVEIRLKPTKMVRQLQLLLLRLGVFSSLHRIRRNNGKLAQGLTLPLKSIEELSRIIPIKGQNLEVAAERIYGYKKLEKGFAVTIEKIVKNDYSGIVYDFEVEEGESFLAAPCLVHNSRISHYKPHWYHLMQTRARERALYGSEEEKWQYSPLLHPFKALFDEEFKYHWERKHYAERPYPVTGTFGAEIPFIGPAIAATVGKLIKPPRYMHEEEWRTTTATGEPSYLEIPTAGEGRISPELGGLPTGAPVSQLEAKQTVGELIYRANELRGLTGFMHGAIKEALTGSQDYFDQTQQLETAARMTSPERAYWEMELGGLGGMTEAFRRFLPHRRRQIGLYNPIRNRMPDWMPGPNYFQDFLHGDPYTKVQGGEWRLPGPGYEALNPDIAGLAPEDYPTYHRFKILSDVAMWSDEFKEARRQVRTAIKRGELSEDQIANFQKINEQISERKKRKRFMEYQFSEDALQQMKVQVKKSIAPGVFETEKHGVFRLSGIDMAHDLLAQENKSTIGSPTYRRKQALVSDYLREYVYPGAELDVYVHRDPLHRYKKGVTGYYQPAAVVAGGTNIGRGLVESGLAEYPEEPEPFTMVTKYGKGQRALGKAWEAVAHFEPPTEYLTPFSPMAKFMHQRSAIEEYERTRAYGTESAFWQHPIAHFLKPAYWMARRGLGTEELPPDVQRRTEIETYFDRLKWVKYYALEQAANKMKDDEAAEEFRKQKRRTLFGVDPYGSLSYVYSALPTLDRDYFQEFKDAQSQEERNKILKMIPPDQRPIYQAQWAMKTATALRAQQAMGMEDESTASLMKSLNLARMAEGRPVSPELMEEYREERTRGESYADWSRKKAIREYFTEHPLPGPNWVGWTPNVDLEDLKLKMADNEALDIHDFNLWPNRRREMIQKPYIEEAYEQMERSETLPPTASEMTQSVETVLRNTLSLDDVHVQAFPIQANENIIEIEINDNRRDAIDMYKRDNSYMAMI